MKKILIALFLVLSTSAFATQIVVDKKTQRMYVDSPEGVFTWKVSTARKGYHTPSGTYTPYSLQPMHYSKKYDNAPMPNSIFFNGGYAIHATPHVGALGRPASHGCVRLSPANAKTLYGIVGRDRENTVIHIQ